MPDSQWQAGKRPAAKSGGGGGSVWRKYLAGRIWQKSCGEKPLQQNSWRQYGGRPRVIQTRS